MAAPRCWGLDNQWSDGHILRNTDGMTKFNKGDKVVAAKDIGGFARDHVPKGSVGYVTDAGWGNRAEVTFKVAGGFLSGEKKVTIRADDDEIF